MILHSSYVCPTNKRNRWRYEGPDLTTDHINKVVIKYLVYLLCINDVVERGRNIMVKSRIILSSYYVVDKRTTLLLNLSKWHSSEYYN